MREKFIVRLTEEERKLLKEMVTKGKTAVYKVKHANILLAADVSGLAWEDEKIAKAYSVNVSTVGSLRKRLVEQGLEAALGRKKQVKPSREPTFDGAAEARLIALSCSKPPEGCSRWTLRLLADTVVELDIVDKVSHETVRQTLKKTNSSRILSRNG